MARRLDEQDNLDFFNEKYARPRSDARREVERAVLGDDVGLNGFTTVEQAQALVDHLSLLPTTHLLDVGAGHGWPGSYLARCSGCSLVASDVPIDALRAAKAYLDQGSAVAADGCALPFRSAAFGGVVHADVLC